MTTNRIAVIGGGIIGTAVARQLSRSTGRLVHVRHAASPGASASLAIAEHIVEEALAHAG